jgi:preprotein translocase subunit SecA
LVVSIPTNKPSVRIDLVDKIFKTEDGKFRAIARDIKGIYEKGQPVLIGTTSIEKNLLLSRYLKDLGIPHELLNAKNHEQEARIVSQAGIKGAVTLATNIAGRGVDIKLGGEIPEDKTKYDEWHIAHEEVKSLGGLFVIGTERHESRRIDNQLRGRAGRQGDPGKSQFYISLEDYILRVFGGDRVSYYNILPIADDEAIQNKLLSRLIEEAQKRIEGQNYDSRKGITEYDDVINRQRTVIYSRRKKVLLNEGFDADKEVQVSINREVSEFIQPIPKKFKIGSVEFTNFIDSIAKEIKKIDTIKHLDTDSLAKIYAAAKNQPKLVSSKITKEVLDHLDQKWSGYTSNEKNALARFIFLRAIDGAFGNYRSPQ